MNQNIPDDGIVHILYTIIEESTDDYTVRHVVLHGIFTNGQIRNFRHKNPHATCFLVPLNRFLDKGVKL